MKKQKAFASTQSPWLFMPLQKRVLRGKDKQTILFLCETSIKGSICDKKFLSGIEKLRIGARLKITLLLSSSQNPPIDGSIQNCDKAIFLWKKNPDDTSMEDMIWSFGAYFGSILAEDFNMTWHERQNTSDFDSYFLLHSEFSIQASPFLIVQKVLSSKQHKKIEDAYSLIAQDIIKASN